MKDAPKDSDDEPEPEPEAEPEPEPEPAPEPDADERPVFARDWPKNPDLDRLLLAFQRGNYAFVRSEAPRLAKSTDRPRVRDAANDLRRRIDPDPLAGVLILVAIALLVTLSGYYLSGAHKHDEAPAPNIKPQPVPMQPRGTPQPRST